MIKDCFIDAGTKALYCTDCLCLVVEGHTHADKQPAPPEHPADSELRVQVAKWLYERDNRSHWDMRGQNIKDHYLSEADTLIAIIKGKEQIKKETKPCDTCSDNHGTCPYNLVDGKCSRWKPKEQEQGINLCYTCYKSGNCGGDGLGDGCCQYWKPKEQPQEAEGKDWLAEVPKLKRFDGSGFKIGMISERDYIAKRTYKAHNEDGVLGLMEELRSMWTTVGLEAKK